MKHKKKPKTLRKRKRVDPYDEELADYIYDPQRDEKLKHMKGIGDIGKP